MLSPNTPTRDVVPHKRCRIWAWGPTGNGGGIFHQVQTQLTYGYNIHSRTSQALSNGMMEPCALVFVRESAYPERFFILSLSSRYGIVQAELDTKTNHPLWG